MLKVNTYSVFGIMLRCRIDQATIAKQIVSQIALDARSRITQHNRLLSDLKIQQLLYFRETQVER
jgi:hypothetical protein